MDDKKTPGLMIRARTIVSYDQWKPYLQRAGILIMTSDIINLRPSPDHLYMIKGSLHIKPRAELWEIATLPGWQIVGYNE